MRIELHGVALAPRALAVELDRGAEAADGEIVRRRVARLDTDPPVELGEAEALRFVADQAAAAVQVGDDVEQAAIELRRGRHREPRAADREMQPRPVALRQRNVRGLLHSIVRKANRK